MEVIDDNNNQVTPQENKRVIAGILAIVLGVFGVHKFILGYTKEGIFMLIISILTCGTVSSIIGPTDTPTS